MFEKITNWPRRVMSALSEGAKAANKAYRQGDHVTFAESFDSYDARMERYDQGDVWAENEMYGRLNPVAEAIKTQEDLYKHIREIYNPVDRLNEIEVAKVYGGPIDWTEGLRTGAIPIAGAAQPLRDAIAQIFEWSNFEEGKDLYVRNGSKYGDSFIAVVEDFDAKKVRLEVLDPRRVKDVEHDAVGNVKKIVIEYFYIDEEDGEEHQKRIEMTKTQLRSWRDDKPYPFLTDTNGVVTDEADNEFGFVPVVHVRHRNKGRKWGATSWAPSRRKINQLNDQASVIDDNLRVANNPYWAIEGGVITSATSKNKKRDDILTVNVPVGSKVTPMVVQIDVVGALQLMNQKTGEIERDQPLLALQRIRESGGDPSGKAIENAYADAVAIVLMLQGRYDGRLIRAIQMALTIAGIRGIRGFPYTRESYAAGVLKFSIVPRPAFTDRVPPVERARLLMEASEKAVWFIVARDLGVSQADIDKVEQIRLQMIAVAVRGAMEAAFKANTADRARQEPDNGNEEDIEDDTIEAQDDEGSRAGA